MDCKGFSIQLIKKINHSNYGECLIAVKVPRKIHFGSSIKKKILLLKERQRNNIIIYYF